MQNDSLRSFKIYNKGNGQLIIYKCITSCSCSTLNLNKNQSIEAGDSLTVQIKIDKKNSETNDLFTLLYKQIQKNN